MNSLPLAPLKYRHSILVVDDEEAILDIMTIVLAREGYDLHTASSAEEGLKKLREIPDLSLIISDQIMPGMTGVEFLEQALSIRPDAQRVLLTGFTDTDAIINAINKGRIHLYISKPWRKEELLYTINQLLAKAELVMENKRLDELVKKQNAELVELNRDLEAKVRLKTIDLDRRAEELKASYEKIQMILDGTVLAMSRIVESRDPYTAGHQQQVTQIASIIAEKISLPPERVEAIRISAALHDIGKISVPSEILTKPSRLTDLEREPVSYTHLRAHETVLDLVCRLLLEKKKKN